MNRRSEPRFPTKVAALITLLDGSGARLYATAVDLSCGGMRVAVDAAVAPGTPVKIETPDALYLAEVCYVNAQEGGFAIGLKVDQMLIGSSDLARLRHFVHPMEVSDVFPEPSLR